MRYLLLVLVACGSPQRAAPTTPTETSITGLARDHDSGEVIAKAQIHLRPQGQITPIATLTQPNGTYALPHLAPGNYSLTASFAGQNIDVANIVLLPGAPTVIDLTFTLGRPDAITVDFGNPKDSAIDRYAHEHALIEGTISDRGSHVRVGGAVITAIGPGAGRDAPTLQAVSDDQGRYRFDPVLPGTYIVSAYYSVEQHGQIEVRRSGIEVPAKQGVIVPLWVETGR